MGITGAMLPNCSFGDNANDITDLHLQVKRTAFSAYRLRLPSVTVQFESWESIRASARITDFRVCVLANRCIEILAFLISTFLLRLFAIQP